MPLAKPTHARALVLGSSGAKDAAITVAAVNDGVGLTGDEPGLAIMRCATAALSPALSPRLRHDD